MISARLARRLRPIARERARLMKMKPGDELFYGGHLYARVKVSALSRMKPYPSHFFRIMHNGVYFHGAALYANIDEFHYTNWSILFDMRPKRRRRLENRIRRAERKRALRELRAAK